ncbi:MAG: 4Fe-4S dicluster domain-containing protein, partial [Deltaproteobacteria bacterium]
EGLDLWVLVANSGGINVWCAACGGFFTDHQVISAVKTSMLAEKVAHRTLILPPLSAPGMSVAHIRQETGFRVRFGPTRASDIPAYLAAGKEKTDAMKRADFSLGHRLDMMVSMNFIIWLPLAVLLTFVLPGGLLRFSLLFWGIVGLEYLFFPWIPGRTGWRKALFVALLLGAGGIARGYTTQTLSSLWPWIAAGMALAFAVGFDLAGIAGPMPSDAEAFLQRLGVRGMGSLMREKTLGSVTLTEAKCIGCYPICNDICPIGVFGVDKSRKKTVIAHPDACFGCGACVRQCPREALSLAAR